MGGLKYVNPKGGTADVGPISHGMGGLKFGISERDKKLVASHLMRDSLKDVLK